MANKKHILLFVALIAIFQLSAVAQITSLGWNWKDSSKIAPKHLAQYQAFVKNEYPYPPTPRNMWELGLGMGVTNIIGDVAGKAGIGLTGSLRKALGHVISVRGSYTGMFNSGTPTVPGAQMGQLPYRSQTHMLGMDVIASLNTISSHRGNPKSNIYVLAGYSLVAHYVTIDPGTGYRTWRGQGSAPDNQAGVLTTVGGPSINGRKAWTVLNGINAGAGIALKVSNRVNLGLEQKFTFMPNGYDYLDASDDGIKGSDFFSFTSLRANFNLGNSSKRVQPLWWENPNNYVYEQLNAPNHMKLPFVKLADDDNDGVPNQLDWEPNTPAGATVDTHGRAYDSDGDGVPDYRDRELLTLQKCFPVDQNGVGNCPEPPCCIELRNKMIANEAAAKEVKCTIGILPNIQFKNDNKLTKEGMAVLANIAQVLNANPNCKIKVTGYGNSTKKAQQLSWEKVNNVVRYLVEKEGISEFRLIYVPGQNGDPTIVDFTPTMEAGPTFIPAPHPNLK